MLSPGRLSFRTEGEKGFLIQAQTKEYGNTKHIRNSNALATWCKKLTHWKRPWFWERLKVGGERDNRGWDGWKASPTRWTWVWVSSGAVDGQGSLACCSPWGRKVSDVTERLNWPKSIASMRWFLFSKISILLMRNLRHRNKEYAQSIVNKI